MSMGLDYSDLMQINPYIRKIQNQKIMKILSVTFIMILISLTIYAQENEKSAVKADIGLQYTSRHYWRGISVSSAPCFEGSLSLNKGGFNIGYWGGYAYDNTYSEFDINGSYTFRNFTFSFIDLYVISDEDNLASYHPEQRYWDFNRETTSHNIDLTASYNLGKRFPLTLSYSTMVWGADRDENGKQRFSDYLEAKYPFSLAENTNLELFCGMTFNDKPGAYGDGIGVVNIGVSSTYTIRINEKIAFPVSATIAMNPQKETGFLVLAIGIL